MIKPTIFLGFILLGLVTFTVYEVENRVDGLSSHLSAMNEELVDNKEAIHVLKAEWSYLNKPERIKEISQKHFSLRNISSDQIRDIDDLPIFSSAVMQAKENKKVNQQAALKE